MKAMLVHRAERDGYDLYLYAQVGNLRVAVSLDGEPMSAPMEPHAEIPRTAFLGHEVMDALRLAFVGDAVDNDNALADCRQVRDRLLSLVEEGWHA